MATRTDELRRVISRANELARSRGDPFCRTDHLLEAIVTEPDSAGLRRLQEAGGQPEWFVKSLEVVRERHGSDVMSFALDALYSDGLGCKPRDTVELLENFPIGSTARQVLAEFGY